MMNSVFVKSYPAPKINEKEILRYAGVRENITQINQLVSECLSELNNRLTFKVCYAKFPIEICNDSIDLTFTRVRSEMLARNLKNCSHIVLFAATIGIEIDRLIAKYSVISQAKALIFQAIGAERIESLCDMFNEKIKEEYKNTSPRFSPGYGDFSLEIQRDIFSTLDCSKKIGVSLNQSLLMSPAKSVTAIIGIKKESITDKQR